MTVKADSKGRLTGAQPETKYLRKEHPDGRIEYTPELTPFKPSLSPVVAVTKSSEPLKTRLTVEVYDEGVEDLAETIAAMAKAVETTQVLIHSRGTLGAVADYMRKYQERYTVVEYQ